MRIGEVTQLRDRYTKHFETDVPGQYEAIVGVVPLHFRHPDGYWEDMDRLVQAVAGGWAAATADVRFAVESGYLTIAYKGRSMQMRPTAIGMVDRTAPATRWRKLADASYANVTRDGATLTVHDIFPQTDLTVTLTDERMVKEFTVRQKPNLPDPTSLGWDASKTYLVIVWDVQVPTGATVRDTVTDAVVSNGYLGNNDLVVEDNTGSPVLYFKSGIGTSARGVTRPVWYIVAGAAVPFGEAFAYATTQIATYPVVLDPTASITLTAGNQAVIRHAVEGYTAGATTASTWGTDFVAGDPGAKPPTSDTGGPVHALLRFDLTSLAGASCSAADLRADYTMAYPPSYPIVNVNKIADWYPIDLTDWDLAKTLIGSANLASAPYSDVFSDIAWIGDRWLAVGSRTSNQWPGTWESTDNGATWTLTDTTNRIARVWYLGGIVLGGGQGVNAIWRYAAGAWSQVSGNYTVNLAALGHNGTSFLAIHSNGMYQTSSNGTSWSGPTTAVNLPAGATGICWTGSEWWIATLNGLRHAATPSGSWTTGALPAGNPGPRDIIWDGSKFVLSTDGSSSNCNIWYSGDGATWTIAYTPPSSYRLDRLVLANGIYIAIADTNLDGVGQGFYPHGTGLATSPNGIDWTLRYQQTGSEVGTVSRPRYGNGVWLCAGGSVYSPSGGVGGGQWWGRAALLSADGSTWTPQHSPLASLTPSAVEASFGAWFPVEIEDGSDLGQVTCGNLQPTLVITYSSGPTAPTWVSPADAASISDSTPFVLTSLAAATDGHFELQFDSVNTFNSGNLKRIRSYIDSGWEYWDGAAWQPLTASGMPAAKTGNNVRYTPSPALTPGTWYRRVRQNS